MLVQQYVSVIIPAIIFYGNELSSLSNLLSKYNYFLHNENVDVRDPLVWCLFITRKCLLKLKIRRKDGIKFRTENGLCYNILITACSIERFAVIIHKIHNLGPIQCINY